MRPGDVLLFSNGQQISENWREIGHVSIVTKIVQSEGGWVETIEAESHTPVVEAKHYSRRTLRARKVSCAARFPLHDTNIPVVLLNGGVDDIRTSNGGHNTIRFLATGSPLLENTVCTLFFCASISASRFPVVSIGSIVVDTLTPNVLAN